MNQKSKLPILITGAAGFIGSNLSRVLSQDNIPWVGVDWDKDAVRRQLQTSKGAIWMSSFDDPGILEAVASSRFRCVIHLAATARVQLSVDDPVGTHENNVERSLRLIDACRSSDTRFIFASSSAVYGNCHRFPTQENDTKKPLSPYGLQKLIIDNYVNLFGSIYGSDMVALRFFNVYGPGQKPGGTYPMAITAWNWAIAQGQIPELYGDGTIERDYIYVDDVAEAICSAALHSERFSGQSMNICSGNAQSMISVWNSIREVSGASVDIKFMPPRSGDPQKTLGDNSFAKSILDWSPIVPFSIGVEKTWEWVNAEIKKSTLELTPG